MQQEKSAETVGFGLVRHMRDTPTLTSKRTVLYNVQYATDIIIIKLAHGIKYIDTRIIDQELRALT